MSFLSNSDQIPEWAAHVPDDWKRDRLKWHVSLSTERPDDDERASLPYLSNEDIASWTGKLLREELEPAEADSRLFRTGDILFNKLRPYLAKVFRASFDGVSSGELLCLRPSDRVDSRYLFYVLTSFGFIDAVDSQTFGSKMPRADWETVGYQPLPMPCIDTQQRIAHFLDEKTARIDALIEKKQALLERLAEQHRALITRAVTKGLNSNASLKPSGFDWIGDIPIHWCVFPLRRLTRNVTTGRTPPSGSVDYFTEGNLNWFTPGDFGNGLEIFESERKIVRLAVEHGLATIFPVGTVFLVAIGATLGKVAVATTPGSANQQVNAITLKAQNNPHFLAHFLHSFREEVRMTSNGNTLGILNQDGTKSLMVTRPPSKEQDAIAAYVEEQSRRNSLAIGKIEHSCQLLAGYRAAVITAAVTGQLPELNG